MKEKNRVVEGRGGKLMVGGGAVRAES